MYIYINIHMSPRGGWECAGSCKLLSNPPTPTPLRLPPESAGGSNTETTPLPSPIERVGSFNAEKRETPPPPPPAKPPLLLPSPPLVDILTRQLEHTATHCSILEHTAKHCNTLQLTATTGRHSQTSSRYDMDKRKRPWS